MRWVGLFTLALGFPVSLLIWGEELKIALKNHEVITGEVIRDHGALEHLTLTKKLNTQADLLAASAETLKKIDEIDRKIDSARQDLRKNEAAKREIIKDLVKIQAKIDAVIKSDLNL